MPLHPPPPTGPKTVQVMKSEEKGSDVNIATYLLVDAFDDEYEAAVVISNPEASRRSSDKADRGNTPAIPSSSGLRSGAWASHHSRATASRLPA